MESVSIWHWLVFILFFGSPILLKLMGVGAKAVPMRNPATGQMKTGYFGFSWTYLFFGFLVPLVRGELGVGALHLLFSIVTVGLWQLVLPFLYNRQYTQRLVEKGYKFAGTDEQNALAARKIGVDLNLHLSGMPRA